MITLILRRILIAIPTLFLVSLFVFALQRALPGDPVLVMAGEERDPEVLARLRELYRMNDPLFVQFFAWLGQVVQGDFGRSLRTGEPVLGLILQKLPVTLQLATAAILVSLKLDRQAPSLAEATGEKWPAGIERFLERALERDRERRFGSAGEALAEWRAIQPVNLAARRSERIADPTTATSVDDPPTDVDGPPTMTQDAFSGGDTPRER